MAYSPFPVGYQPQQIYYQPNYQPVQNTPQNQNTGIIWVSGMAGAKAYMVAPNTTVQLWDSESQTIFLKSADASGMPSMKILDYTIRENDQPVTAQNLAQNDERYVTKEELKTFRESLEKRFSALRKEHDE